jgi:FKBP-type peptidyl-prolyl cis-trans isomerase FkpA
MKTTKHAWMLAALAASTGPLLVAGCNKGGGQTGGATAAKPLQTEEQKTFYALGLLMGRSLTMFKLKPADLEYVKMGVEDMALGNKPQVELKDYAPKVQELARSRSQAANEASKADAEKEKTKGKEYAEKMAKEPGAQVSPSGLVFIPMKEGTGDMPKATDRVKVHYHGTLSDGTVFDSSVKRGEPAEFPLNGVIPCWTEGVQKIKKGGKAKLICPSGIAYGDSGRPPTIPGGATLTFEVELIDILGPPAAMPNPHMPMPAPGGSAAPGSSAHPGAAPPH